MRNQKKEFLFKWKGRWFLFKALAPAHTSSLSSMVKNEIFIREECKSCSAKKCHFQSTNPYTIYQFEFKEREIQRLLAKTTQSAALMSRLSKARILEMEMANKKYMTTKNNVLI